MTLADVLRAWIPKKTVTDRFLVMLSAKARATGAADAEPAKASKRSGRSAAERVAKKVGSTFGGVKAATSANGR